MTSIDLGIDFLIPNFDLNASSIVSLDVVLVPTLPVKTTFVFPRNALASGSFSSNGVGMDDEDLDAHVLDFFFEGSKSVTLIRIRRLIVRRHLMNGRLSSKDDTYHERES